MDTVKNGTILISDPFLKDPNFVRTVVLLCDHEATGTCGFVINRKTEDRVSDLISDMEGCDFPVYYGGPVQTDTVHILHRRPDLITDSIEVVPGVFWGGDFTQIIQYIHAGLIAEKDIRFYIGYSGWGEGQLAEELEEKSWITSDGSEKLVFFSEPEQIWKEALKEMGGEYQQLIHYPLDPQLN